MRKWQRRTWALTSAGIVTTAGAAATWLLWPSPSEPAPRERHYGAAAACLLTDDKGLAGDQSRAAWAGMQEASATTLIKVQYLAVTGPQTPANALAYYNSLGQQKCTAIIAVGDVPVAAMVAGYAHFPDIRHAAVGGDTKDLPITQVETTSPAAILTATRAIVSEAG